MEEGEELGEDEEERGEEEEEEDEEEEDEEEEEEVFATPRGGRDHMEEEDQVVEALADESEELNSRQVHPSSFNRVSGEMCSLMKGRKKLKHIWILI